MHANNSFKPNLLRYTKHMAEKACHVFGSATQVGLTQALGLAMKVLALLLAIVSIPALGGSGQSVVIGGEGAEVDACPSLGVTTKSVHLRAGPGTRFSSAKIIPSGTHLHICSSNKNREWTSVVLAIDGMLDCKVSSPVPHPQPYTGPCPYGWISTRYVKVIAG